MTSRNCVTVISRHSLQSANYVLDPAKYAQGLATRAKRISFARPKFASCHTPVRDCRLVAGWRHIGDRKSARSAYRQRLRSLLYDPRDKQIAVSPGQCFSHNPQRVPRRNGKMVRRQQSRVAQVYFVTVRNQRPSAYANVPAPPFHRSTPTERSSAPPRTYFTGLLNFLSGSPGHGFAVPVMDR